jgi:hypothetical protein
MTSQGFLNAKGGCKLERTPNYFLWTVYVGHYVDVHVICYDGHQRRIQQLFHAGFSFRLGDRVYCVASAFFFSAALHTEDHAKVSYIENGSSAKSPIDFKFTSIYP